MHFNYLLIIPALLSFVAGLPTPVISADKNVRSTLTGRNSVSASRNYNGKGYDGAFPSEYIITNMIDWSRMQYYRL